MKAVMLYRPRSEHARVVDMFVRDIARQQGVDVELKDLDTREGAELGNLYGLMQYPALLIIRDDGQLLKDWQGETLPLMDEVASYLVG